MHEDTVTTSWKRLTDKVKRLWDESVDDSFAQTSGAALHQTTCGAVALGEHPAATAVAGCRTDRDGDAIRQAARLATWEDEGGTTALVE